MDYFWIGVKLIICIWVHIIKLKNFYFLCFNSFTFYLILRSFLAFLGPIGLFWKLGGG